MGISCLVGEKAGARDCCVRSHLQTGRESVGSYSFSRYSCHRRDIPLQLSSLPLYICHTHRQCILTPSQAHTEFAKMSSLPQPQPEPASPGLPRVFRTLENLKLHLRALEQALTLTIQQHQRQLYSNQK